MTKKTYRLSLMQHVTHEFYCSSEERADEILHAIENKQASPKDFPKEYYCSEEEPSYTWLSTSILRADVFQHRNVQLDETFVFEPD